MVTKLDVLDTFAKIPVCIGYTYKGAKLDNFPADMTVLNRVECEYVVLDGWQTDISKCTSYDQLPENAKKYLKFIEDFLGVPSMWAAAGKRCSGWRRSWNVGAAYLVRFGVVLEHREQVHQPLMAGVVTRCSPMGGRWAGA
jgi:hypothetical protein